MYERNFSMRKISFILALILALGAVLSSCGGRSYTAFHVDPDYQASDSGSTSNTVQDFDGNKITLPKEIQNIVCFSPEAAIILRGVGAQKYIKAIDEETTNAVVNNNVITIDKIKEQNPEIVFIEDTYEDIESALGDIPYIKVPAMMTINDAMTLIKIIEKAMNSKRDSMADTIDSKLTIAQTTTADFEEKYPTFVDLGEYKTSGTGTYVNEIINVCGGVNVFADREGYFTATTEEIVNANPTFIFTTQEVNVYTRDLQLKQLDCIKNGNVIKIEPAKIKYASQNIADVITEVFDVINEYHRADLEG